MESKAALLGNSSICAEARLVDRLLLNRLGQLGKQVMRQ